VSWRITCGIGVFVVGDVFRAKKIGDSTDVDDTENSVRRASAFPQSGYEILVLGTSTSSQARLSGRDNLNV
jgi:hypothetical protein